MLVLVWSRIGLAWTGLIDATRGLSAARRGENRAAGAGFDGRPVVVGGNVIDTLEE